MALLASTRSALAPILALPRDANIFPTLWTANSSPTVSFICCVVPNATFNTHTLILSGTNKACPFKHPMPVCRNGADCPTRESGCTFAHSDIMCRYNPCMNPACPYRHTDGQKRGNFADKVWTRDGVEAGKDSHVSERKFVNEDGEAEEELILPGRNNNEMAMMEGLATADKDSSATEGRASPESLGQADIVT